MSDKSQFTLRSLLEKEKLKSDGSNFIDWYRNVRIVLRQEQKDKVLTTAPPKPPGSCKTGSNPLSFIWLEVLRLFWSIICIFSHFIRLVVLRSSWVTGMWPTSISPTLMILLTSVIEFILSAGGTNCASRRWKTGWNSLSSCISK